MLAVAGESEPLAALARSGGGALAALAIDDGDLERVLAGSDAANALNGASLVHERREDERLEGHGRLAAVDSAAARAVRVPQGLGGRGRSPLLFLQLAPAPAQAGVLDAFQRPDQRGARAFAEGRFAESAQQLRGSGLAGGGALSRGRLRGRGRGAREATGPTSQYNLGNALAKAGKLEDAVAAYERALAAAPTDADARFNRDLVKKLLEQQRSRRRSSSKDGKGAQDQAQGGGAGAAERESGLAGGRAAAGLGRGQG